MGKKFKVHFWAAVSTEVEAVGKEDAEKWGRSFLESITLHVKEDFKVNIDATDIMTEEIK